MKQNAVPNALDRRGFLGASAFSLAGAGMGFWAGGASAASQEYKSLNEQPTIAYIGTGVRYHNALGPQGMDYGPCAAICDVDAMQIGRADQLARRKHAELGRPIDISAYEDYRYILDRNDIDAVFIGTPDHWHTKIAVEAFHAGKDVYCEKPLTLTIREGQQLLGALKKTGRVLQVGTQQRTEYDNRFALAVAMVRAGRVGQVRRATCAVGANPGCNPLSVASAPKHLNWDRWLGQAPYTEYLQGAVVDRTGWGAGFPLGRTHVYFRWWYEYSGGIMTDWGAHHVDIATWALDKQRSDIGLVQIDPLHIVHPVPLIEGMPSRSDCFNTATRFNVLITFEDGVELELCHNAKSSLGFDRGVMFEGDQGRFLVNRTRIVGRPVQELADAPLADDAVIGLYGGRLPESHIGDFFHCVKTREDPVSDAQSHLRALSICHAAAISMRLGRKLVYDPAREEFVGDKQANSFLGREQRKGYEIPA